MYRVIATVKSVTPYQQGRMHNTPKNAREAADAYEERTWKDRAHYNEDGQVYIPPMQFKKAIQNAVSYAKEPIPGKGGKLTYKQMFLSAVTCITGPVLPWTRETVKGIYVAVPSDGKPGGSTRVLRCFPTFAAWEGDTIWEVYDDIITPEIFERHLKLAGMMIGLGVWRVQSGGLHGRFAVEEMVTEDVVL